jgi:hypothetical protein
MNRHHRLLVLPFLLLLAACSQSPKPTAPGKVAGAGRIARVSLFCSSPTRTVSFETMGIPSEERPVQVALDSTYAYVLFPTRILRLPLEGDQVEPEMTLNRGKEAWVSLDLDPVDGSVWIATDQFVLRRITPGWQSEMVEVRNVGGDGGFDGIRVARDAIYATPVCAKDAVWRLDRQGNVLGSAFPIPDRPAPDPDEVLDPMELGCSKVRLERNPEGIDGNVFAWDFGEHKIFNVDAQGAWTEADPGVFKEISIHPSTARGADVGTKSEQWYVSGIVRSLVYWKGRPVFLGSHASRPDSGVDTVLVVPGKTSPRDALHTCGGEAIQHAATTTDHYAAITDRALILGGMSGTPDLPY